MIGQDQNVGNGDAYQAGRDLTVVQGIGADQIAEVMVAMGRRLQVHFSEAQTVLDDRLNEFREALLSEFARPQNQDAANSFRDPDFQYVLSDAQKAFTRDGSEILRDELIQLLLKRAHCDSRERLAKILNKAIEMAGQLTNEEYSILAIGFLVSSVRVRANSSDQLLRDFSDYIAPFCTYFNQDNVAFSYLESQHCVAFSDHRNLGSVLHADYSESLSETFPRSKIYELGLSNEQDVLTDLFQEAPYHQLQFCTRGNDVRVILTNRNLPDDVVDRVCEFYRQSIPSEEAILKRFRSVPGFDVIEKAWDTTSLSTMVLNVVGQTIAHSTLSGRTPFDFPLSLWVD